MKKNIIISLACLLSLLLIYFGYKTFLLMHYSVDISNIEKVLDKSTQQIKIVHKEQPTDKISKFSIISYRDFGNDFILEKSKMTNDNMYTYKYYVSKNDTLENYKNSIEMNILDTSLYKLLIDNKPIRGINKERLLNKYNIDNDNDIIEYIKNNNINIFSSSDKIKMNYLMKTFAGENINASNIYLIDGSVKGYIYNINDIYDVYLYYQSYQSEYELMKISFKNMNDDKYFNLDYIKEFLSYIKLEYGIE